MDLIKIAIEPVNQKLFDLRGEMHEITTHYIGFIYGLTEDESSDGHTGHPAVKNLYIGDSRKSIMDEMEMNLRSAGITLSNKL